MRNLSDAQNLAEFVAILKEEHSDSDASLGEKIGIGAATVYRLRSGSNADDDTLNKVADFAGVSREWLYQLAKNLATPAQYSPLVRLIADLLEQLPPGIQEAFLIQARAHLEVQRKQKPPFDK